MKVTHTALSAALIGCGLLSCSSMAFAGPEFKFSGFGTLGAVHSSEKQADFIGSIFQRNGAGYSEDWSFGVDSKLGGQVNATLNEKWSAVLQVIAQQTHDNNYTPQVEWANVKYQWTPQFSVRLGRIALPSSMISESRPVDYANPWVRPPAEVYSMLAVTNNDGIDATYRSQFGSVNNTVQAYYGGTTAKLPNTTFTSKPTWGLQDTAEIGSFTLRANFTSTTIDLTIPSLSPLMNGLQQFATAMRAVPVAAYQRAASQAQAMADNYSFKDITIHIVALGVSYDPGQWFVMSELAQMQGDGFFRPKSRSWYATAGYRIGSFTPYVTYSTLKRSTPHDDGISTAGLDPTSAAGAAGLSAGVNTTLLAFNPHQNTTSAGLRWDFMKNTALKVQYDRINIGENSNGRLYNVQPGFQQGGRVNLISVALNTVF